MQASSSQWGFHISLYVGRDVAGVDTAKEELLEVVACLRDSSKYAQLNARMPPGVLLTGVPGTGKTLLGEHPQCSFLLARHQYASASVMPSQLSAWTGFNLFASCHDSSWLLKLLVPVVRCIHRGNRLQLLLLHLLSGNTHLNVSLCSNTHPSLSH